MKVFWYIRNLFMYVLPYPFMGELNHFNSRRNHSRQKSRYAKLISQQSAMFSATALSITQKKSIFRQSLLIISHLLKKILRLFHFNEYNLVKGIFSTSEFDTLIDGEVSECVFVQAGKKTIPGGMVYLDYEIHSESNLLDLTLYIDAGFGFSRDYCIPLIAVSNKRHVLLLDLPPFINALLFRFRNLNTESSQLVYATLRETNVFLAARTLSQTNSTTYKKSLNDLFIRQFPFVRTPDALKGSYSDWIERNDLVSKAAHHQITSSIISHGLCIKFHFIFICNEYDSLLIRSFIGLKKQLYPFWKITVISTVNSEKFIKESASQHDVSYASVIVNEPVLLTGKLLKEIVEEEPDGYVCFPRSGDILPEHSLYQISRFLQINPKCNILYGDHDHLDMYGHRFNHSFKPDWDYEMFLESNYLEQPLFFKTSTITLSIRNENGTSVIDPDNLVHLILENSVNNIICHMPFILCHRFPDARRYVDDDKISFINNHLDKMKIDATATRHPYASHLVKITRGSSDVVEPVTLIIPTRNQLPILSNCVTGLLNDTDYPNLEVLIIDNGSDEPDTIAYLESITNDPRVNVLPFPGVFNFSAINNFAVEHSKNEYIGLINNDISVIHGTWLQEMMRHLVRPDVGIVGAKLLYADDTVQHGGTIIGLGGVAGHSFRHFPRFDTGYNDRLFVMQRLSCTTGACLMTKKSLYKELGGMDEAHLKVAFNDVDFCLKMRESGHLIIWTPYAELYHLESASRGSDMDDQNYKRWLNEYEYMKNKWGDALRNEPAYNLNLTDIDENFHISHIPRMDRYR